MEAIIWFAAILCLFAGYLISKIESRRTLKRLRAESYWRGFDDGMKHAYEDAGEVRRAYLYHFDNRS